MARSRDAERSARILVLRRLQLDRAAARVASAALFLSRAAAEHERALARLDGEQENWEDIVATGRFDPGLAVLSAELVIACAEQVHECEAAVLSARRESSQLENELKAAIARTDAAEAAEKRISRNLRRSREEAAAASLEDRVARDHCR